MTLETPRIAVVGSVNLDIVATGPKLPAPGETVTGASLARHPGGKGANQALAAQRLGAQAQLFAKVGADNDAEEALRLLRESHVDLSGVVFDPHAATGVALIAVAACGENQIMVSPGANAHFTPDDLTLESADAVICQLEIPVETAARAAAADAFFCLNAAPAKPLPEDLLRAADLIVVNETEAAFYGDTIFAGAGLTAVTYGAEGAALYKKGNEIARAQPPNVDIVDTTGAGDAFVAALTLACMQSRSPASALSFACLAGAHAASRAGAQPSLDTLAELTGRQS